MEPKEAVHASHSQGAEDQLEERGKQRRTGRGQGGARLQGHADGEQDQWSRLLNREAEAVEECPTDQAGRRMTFIVSK